LFQGLFSLYPSFLNPQETALNRNKTIPFTPILRQNYANQFI